MEQLKQIYRARVGRHYRMLSTALLLESAEILRTRNILLLFFLLHQSPISGEPSTPPSQTSSPPVALQDIGYDGTWKKFCDPEQIDRDFAFYREHELRTLRYLICDMNAEKNVSIASMSPFIAYKYCEMVRFRVDGLLESLVAKMASGDEEKERILLTESSSISNETSCLTTVQIAFEKKCIDEKNPYLRMFKPLLARACAANGLGTDAILLSLDEVCTHRMSGDIDWQPIIDSVPYRGSIS